MFHDKCKLLAASILLTIVFSLSADVHTIIMYDGKQDQWIQLSVEFLTEYLEQSTGQKPLLNSAEPSKYVIRLEVRPQQGDDPETFRLKTAGKGTIVISGATSLAVRHGACEFLERCVGVRWLFQGPNGDYVPKCTEYKLPASTVNMTPVYQVRSFSLNNKPNRKWAAKNKGIFHYDYTNLPGRPWFHHNLCNMLPPAKYTQSHPEFFPVQKGKRFLPEPGFNIFWQYCFTAPGIVDALSGTVNRFFERFPDKYTYSFGVNDGGGFCECERCLALDGTDPNNRTRSYLKCFDAVAKKCYRPGRTFGFLAYGAIRKAPPAGEKYHPSLIPFLTYERLYWADPAKAAKDQRETLEWHRTTGSAVGWYDYLSYRHFLIPKISLNVTPSAIRWGAKNHVKYYYAEAHPAEDWHIGPMLNILLKLLWDPDQDVNAVLMDWCTAAVGEKAAPHLKNYFVLCSDYWEKEVPKTAFFNSHVTDKGVQQYMPMHVPGYLEPLTEELLAKMRTELEQTVRLASPEGKKRAEMFLKGFMGRLPQMKAFLANSALEKKLQQYDFKPVLKENFNKKRLWGTWQRKSSKGKFYYSANDGRDGTGAMAMDLAGSSRDMVFMRSAKVVPGRIYRATVYVRNAGSPPGGHMGLRIAWATKEKAWLDASYEKISSVVEDGSYTWKKLTAVAIAPDVKGCFMKILVSGGKLKSGQVFFDDFLLEEAVP